MMNKLSPLRRQSGFTLVELMVTLVVAFLVIAAVYASYTVQQRNEKIQQQVTQIQQNLRAAMDMISREFPLAGYDPLQTGDYKIIAANQNSLLFTGDLCEDGDDIEDLQETSCATTPIASVCGTPERYCFELFDPNTADGIDIRSSLRRTPHASPNVTHSVADNIDQIEFRYLMNNGTFSPAPGNLDDIVGVQVTILARSDEPDFNYTDTKTYTTLGGSVWNPANAMAFPYDNRLNYRRRMLSKMIYLRNMGLF